jgi:hypothetical protein
MKIYINRKPVTGPWGGGNKTVTALCNYLTHKGNIVTFDLEKNLDFVLILGQIRQECGTNIFLTINNLIQIQK